MLDITQGQTIITEHSKINKYANIIVGNIYFDEMILNSVYI